jgi:predicted nucleic acid-binding protein
MRYLVDTNLLLRLAEPAHEMHADAHQALTTLLARNEDLCFVPQNGFEFWVVATRPVERNGLGWSPALAQAEVTRLQGSLTFLPDPVTLYDEWLRLVSTYGVCGFKAHDTRLVAAMLVHGVTHILTFNEEDFKRYAEITVIVPGNVK